MKDEGGRPPPSYIMYRKYFSAGTRRCEETMSKARFRIETAEHATEGMRDEG
jgi:hypothetical protein